MRVIGTIAVTAVMVCGAVAAAAAYASTHTSAAPAHHQSMQMPMGMDMSTAATTASLPASQLAKARIATAKYANDLNAAKARGYSILTQKIPGMGYHFINPSIKGFNVRKPPILVYEKHGNRWQLGALEWVFPAKPATPPLKRRDLRLLPGRVPLQGRHVRGRAERRRMRAAEPQSGSAFNFWHPPLVTMHVWIWYPNPAGLYASMNPLVPAFK